MRDIKVERVDNQNYSVSVEDFEYKVTLTENYWRELTSGKISKEELIKKSFEFLLEREGPESIIKEFDLPLISHYFPAYEETIKKSL